MPLLPEQKAGRYERLFHQLEKLLCDSQYRPSRLSTAIALLHHKMDYYFWTGFYWLERDELLVGAYQGPLACQKLKKDTGVCWAAFREKATLVVPDVHLFPGHIACDSRSRSEIVVPFREKDGRISGVLDVDSQHLAAFDDTDAQWLEKIVSLLAEQ
jgi:L-methionine (R)-S-oxide reductase